MNLVTAFEMSISFLLGAGSSAVISWFFYRRQLQDQRERDERAFSEQRKRDEKALNEQREHAEHLHQQKLQEKNRADEEKAQEQEERNRQLQRTRIYARRLAKFYGYDCNTGWKILPYSDGSNRVKIENLTGKDFLKLEIYIPPEVSELYFHPGLNLIFSFRGKRPGSKFVITLPGSIDDMEFIEFQGYVQGTKVRYRERVPLDPNITMPEYRS